MNRLRIAAIGIVLIAVALIIVFQGEAAPWKAESTSRCGKYRNDKTVLINGTKLKAEVARTPAAQQAGLSGRPCIEADQAMLFIFDHLGQYAFWMKGMKFPIDIVWIGADHRVVGMEIYVKVSTYPDRFVNKDHPAQYVLEMQDNRAKSLGVNIGTEIGF